MLLRPLTVRQSHRGPSMARQFQTTESKEFAQALIDEFLAMNQQRDLAPQVEPRRMHQAKLTGFQFGLDG